MKNFFLIAFLIFPLASTLKSCSNDDDAPANPVSQLPPATQTGENTIGCLVNGEPLLPRGNLGQNRQCFYQLVDGEYYFGLSFSNKNGEEFKSINIALLQTQISQGQKYILNKNFLDDGDYQGGGGEYDFSLSVLEEGKSYKTTNQFDGELKITNFDSENFIISGTFWFDAVNAEGEIIEIRKGRFDMQYSN